MDKNTTFPGLAKMLLAVVLVAVMACVGGCKGPGEGDAMAGEPGADKGPDAVPVEVVKVSRRAIAASYTGTGALEARAEAQVVAKTSGIAKQVFAEEGQKVAAGQVLVRLDSERERLQVAQGLAQVRKLEANYKRAVQLEAQQMVSANDLDQLKYDLANARAAYDMARLELSYTSVVAPISGMVATRDIKPGNFVQINSPIFRIVDDSRLEVTLNVPERELAKLRPDQAVTLEADALPGRTFTGVVDRVSPVVDTGTGTFRVVAAFDNEDELQTGMFTRLSINYDQRADALVIPRTALLDDGGEPAVYVVRDGKAVRTVLQLGYDDAGQVEVREGLKAGDAVVVAGKTALREGSTVQVLDRDVPGEAKPAAPVAKAPN